jgi:hypothetical protein
LVEAFIFHYLSQLLPMVLKDKRGDICTDFHDKW